MSLKNKGNRDSILNLSKSKRKIIKLFSVDDSIYLFFLWFIGHLYWVRDGCSAIIFVKYACQNSSSKFCFVALLWKLPQMPSCSANKANFDMFYKTDCCLAIHGHTRMNNVPNESRIIMLSCTEISLVIFFFSDFEKFGVKLGFPFFLLTHTVYYQSVTFVTRVIADFQLTIVVLPLHPRQQAPSWWESSRMWVSGCSLLQNRRSMHWRWSGPVNCNRRSMAVL